MMNYRRTPINVMDYRDRARRYLPRAVFDYLEGGSEEERSLRRNRSALDEILFSPKVLQDVSSCDLGVTLFSQKIAAPFILGPTGVNGVLRPDGDILLARAAAKCNLPFVLSTPSSNSIEEVAKAAAAILWFQLYVIDWELAIKLVDRAKDAGYKVLIVTVDAAVSGKRERDLHNSFRAPWSDSAVNLADFVLHPLWTKRFISNGPPKFANLSENEDPLSALRLSQRSMDPRLSWNDIKRLRDRWPFHFVVKGILNPADAEACLRLGADAVVLSNHGGRQLDSVQAGIEVLPEACSNHPDANFIVDGGIRRGSDVVKALAVGAKAVLLGRAPLYGLAADGEHGVCDVIEMLMDEMKRTMILLGCHECLKLDQSYLVSHLS